ncbi:MAG: acyltransferase family protein [Candidatus Latescibacteria bacterium]|nr:acyltransferase family protein [Candidatus Latescibacterota bacterium]
MTKRMAHFDIAKAIGIILMIFGHSLKSDNIIRIFIFTFHIPLFFFISGYFFKAINAELLVKKNFRRLLVPYLFTSLMVIVLSAIYLLISGDHSAVIEKTSSWAVAAIYGSGRTFNSPIPIRPIGAIWFLLALFSAEYLFSTFHQKKWILPIFILLISYIGYSTAKLIWLPFSIQSGMVGIVFMYAGFLFRENSIFDKKIPLPFLILGGLVWFICIKYSRLSLVSCTLKNGFLDVIGAVCAIYFIIHFSIIISRLEILSRIFSYIGRNTLIILCFHLIELNVFPWKLIRGYLSGFDLSATGMFWMVMGIKFLWAFSAVLIVNHIKILRQIFFPENKTYV